MVENLDTRLEEREDLELRVLKLEEKVPHIDGDLCSLTKSTDENHKKFVIGQHDNHSRSTKNEMQISSIWGQISALKALKDKEPEPEEQWGVTSVHWDEYTRRVFECESRIANFANKHYSDNWIERCDSLDKTVNDLGRRVIELGRRGGDAGDDDDEFGFGMDEDKVKEIARDMCRDVAREAAADICKEQVGVLKEDVDGRFVTMNNRVNCKVDSCDIEKDLDDLHRIRDIDGQVNDHDIHVKTINSKLHRLQKDVEKIPRDGGA